MRRDKSKSKVGTASHWISIAPAYNKVGLDNIFANFSLSAILPFHIAFKVSFICIKFQCDTHATRFVIMCMG